MSAAMRPLPSYDERLARRVTDGEPRPRRAALELFEEALELDHDTTGSE